MSSAGYALTMSGRLHDELRDPIDPPELVIRKRLSLLDGDRRFSLGLWALPDGIPFDEVDLDTWPQEYIHAAGSRERMTVEVRRIQEGQPRQYVVGHGGPTDDDGHRAEVIKWGGVETTVHPSEVFSGDEAVELFISYYLTGCAPGTYALRLIEL